MTYSCHLGIGLEASAGALRRLTYLVMAIACITLSPATALADSAQLEIVQFGWQSDGTLTPRGWNPILLRASGFNEASARVQVTLKLSFGSANQTFITPIATYAQDVSLPSGTTRDVKLWLPVQADGAYLVTAQVLDAGGHVLAEQSTTTPQLARADGAPLIAAVADSPNLSAQLSKIEVPYQQGLTAQVRSIQLAATDVPSHADYLAGFRGMIVQGATAATLTAEQKRAVQQWVQQGGDLLIVGGADASRAMAVLDGADALGVRFDQFSGSIELQPLATWARTGAALSSGPATPILSSGSELLAGSRDQQLATRLTWGTGSVTLLATDPTLEPLRGWTGTTALLRRALEPALAGASPSSTDPTRPASAVANQSRQDETRLLAAIDALPSNAFPDWQHIALLLGGFALVVGPVLHLVLWRTGRRPWLWLAVPGVSLAVTTAIYVGAALQPGHDVLANVVSEVRVDPITGDARQSMAVGFFAPLHDQLTVQVAGEVPVRVSLGQSRAGSLTQAAAFAFGGGAGSGSFGSGVARGLGAGLPGFRVVMNRDTQVDYVSDATLDNGLRSMVLSRELPHGSFGQFEADLHVQGDGVINGNVRNVTPYSFDEVGLAIGQTIDRVGPMAPGQTASVTFDPRATPPAAPGNLPYSFAWQLYGVASSTGVDVPGDPETRRRLKVVDAVFSTSDRNAAIAYSSNGLPMTRPTAVRPMLVAVTSNAIGGDVLPSVGAQRTFEETVIEIPVRLAIAPGPFTLPSALVPPSVGVEAGASLNPGGQTSPPWFDLRGAATYTFRLDLPANSHIDKLNITTQQANGGPVSAGTAVPAPSRATATGPSTPGTFSIYDWQAAQWQALNAGNREVALAPAAQYIGPDGSVRIQVTSGGTDRMVRFLPPELTLQGEAGS
jgi:hypothetical protein